MNTAQNIGIKFYLTLGKLFYAVAMADKNIRPIEVEKLQDCVREYWLGLGDIVDEYGTNAAYQIEIIFDWLQSDEKEGQAYFEEFKDYYMEHKSKFTPEIKSLILKTANIIAAAFAGKNKSELILLGNLTILFK